MKILIVGAGVLLAAGAAPALANGGGGRSDGASQGYGQHRASNGLRNFGMMLEIARRHGWFSDGPPPGFSSPGNHWGWLRGRHWGWFRPHNPHWPHEHPASP